MIRIVVITHTYDNFQGRNFLLRSFFGHWIDAGYDVVVTVGPDDWPDGDIAVMHVDLSVIPALYAEASRRYAIVVNGAARDIRKKIVSRYRVSPNDGWTGPVIIKTDLNSGGMPELHIGRQALRDGNHAEMPPGRIVSTTQPYPILRSADAVPTAVWNNPGLIVERFLPEQDAGGFWVRAWVFFGDRERCTRYRGNHPIVKSASIVAREPAPVPEELRAERERLGFDYGKFDFVVRDSHAILLDANRTPTAPPPSASPDLAASNTNLACGLDALLRKSS
jgi:hypothetical protein